MKPTQSPFFSSCLAMGAILVAGINAAHGASQTWGTNAGSAWYTAGNWAGGAFPGLQGAAASNTDVATFTNLSTATTFGINMNTASLNLGAVSVDSTRTTATNIGNSSSATAGVLRLYGATVNSVSNVVLRNAGTGLLTLQASQSGGGTMGVVLSNATNNIINIDGTGGVTISSNLSGVGNLTKAGAGSGLLTLSGANSYSGTTTISTGMLQFTKQTSLYNNTTASWTAANLTVASGATAAFNVGGTGEFTTGNVTTLLGNLSSGISSNGLLAGSTIAFDTTNAAGGTFTVADSIANSTGTGSGTLGLTKLGTSILVLSGNNTYTGTTTIAGGTLSLGVSNTLPATASVLFSSPAGAATSRTLDIGSTTQLISRLNVSYNPNGGITHTAFVTGATGSLKVNGAFDLNVTNSSSVTPATTPSVVLLDLSSVGTFEYSAAAQKVIVFGNGNARTATLTLGGTNTLTALAIDVQNGGAGANTAKTSFLNLGQTNTINADTINILNNDNRDSATMQFRALTSPTLKVRATNTTGRANWNIGTNIGTNTSTGNATVDLVTGVTGGSSLDAMVNTLTLGSKSGSSALSANFSMGSGTLDATTIVLGNLTATGTLNSTFSVAGGTVKVGTLNFGTQTAGTLTSVFNLNGGGTLAAQTVSTSGTATRTLNWNSGTISNYDSATDLSIGSGIAIKVAATGTHAFDIGTGRSASVASNITDATTGGTLTKSGSGTLTLTGTNTYTGTTTVSAGTLLVNGSLGATAVTVDSGATLGGVATIGGNVTVNGLISAGNSPGTITLGSTNLSFGSGGSALFELGGTSRGNTSSNYDSIVGINTLTLDGLWTVSLINGFNPVEDDVFDLFDAATVNATGFNLGSDLLLPTLSGGLSWDTSTFTTNGILTVVPEPSSALLGGLGLLGLLRRRRC